MDGMIKVTGASLTELVKAAYDLSLPQGMGFAHYEPGPMSDERAQAIVGRHAADSRIAVSMDYVNGRAVKMTVFRTGGDLWIRKDWFDHSDMQLAELLDRIGVAA